MSESEIQHVPRREGEELKPCPFCGGPAEIWRATPGTTRKAWIACMGGCVAISKEHATDAEAVAGWNRRSLPQPGGWRPIETAPKDGTEIILGAVAQTYQGKPTEPRSTVGHWATDEERREYIGDCGGECRCPEYEYDEDLTWLSWDGSFTKENPPTHWQPLPPVPTDGGKQDGSASSNSATRLASQVCDTDAPSSAGGDH